MPTLRADAYRLAPADQALTETNFQRQPLDFVGLSRLRWDGNKSSDLAFDSMARGWQSSVGTVPKGSTWRKVPIPTSLWEREGPSFEPVCRESEACRRATAQQNLLDLDHPTGDGACRCSGQIRGPLRPTLEIVDELHIPHHLAPGRYVLQWRWDCEETQQIFASCADVTIVAPRYQRPSGQHS